MVSISETLLVSFDHCNDDDIPTLTIARRNGNQLEVLTTFLGDEAYQLYYKLIGAERYPINSKNK